MKDLDAIKKRFGDLSDDYKALKDRYLKEVNDLKDETRQLGDERDKLKKTTTILQRENGDLERSNKCR